MHLIIIGGSDAGVSAALRARELEPGVEISLVLADDYPNFSICGLPYYLSGETPDWRALAHRTAFPGINVLRRHTARSIDPSNKTVRIAREGAEETVRYDRLIVATGAKPVEPDLPGSERDGVFPLHTMGDSFAVHRRLAEHAPRRAVVVGGGYIGIEMADALIQRGLEVTLLCRPPTVLPTVDQAIGREVEAELRGHGVRVFTGVSATRIDGRGAGLCSELLVTDSAGTEHAAGLVILAVGARPASDLGREAGMTLAAKGAIAVTRQMRTNLRDVFAAGDCAQTYHRLLSNPTYISLGTIAHKQGRVAGENAVGGERAFAGALGTQSIKVFDLAIARTGLLEREAYGEGLEPRTVEIETDDHTTYYPGATRLRIHMTGDARSGRLLAGQIVGNRKAEISKRVDVLAAALFQNARIDDLNDLDLSYTPPFSSPWDPIQVAAQAWTAMPPSPVDP